MSADLGENGPEWEVAFEIMVKVNATEEIEAKHAAQYDMDDLVRRRRANIGTPRIRYARRV